MSYKYITRYSSRNFTPARDSKAVFGHARKIKGITIHWWGDPKNKPSFKAVRSYLCTNTRNTSAHYVATGTGRQVACIVNPGDVAWHTGNALGNAITIGIELDPRCRKEDYDVAAELVADIRSAFGDVPIYSHKMWSSTRCPGDYDIKKIDRLSYTKFSHKTKWGKGGDKVTKPKDTPVREPKPQPKDDGLYRLFVSDKQVAAYSTQGNAYKGYIQHGHKGVIKYKGKDITATVLKKYDKPSPKNTDKPEPDYSKQNNQLLKTILSLLQGLVDKISIIFK